MYEVREVEFMHCTSHVRNLGASHLVQHASEHVMIVIIITTQ